MSLLRAFYVVCLVGFVSAALRRPASGAGAGAGPCDPVFHGPEVRWGAAGCLCNAPERDVEQRIPVAFGAIPAWLQGTLYRNVPAQYSVGPDQVQHWFDGLAQINALNLTAGGATWRSRFLNSTSFHTMTRVDRRFSYKGVWTEPYPGPLFPQQSNSTVPPAGPKRASSRNNDVSILEFGGRFFATTDEDVFEEFDPDTLATITGDGMRFRDELSKLPGPLLGVTHGVVDRRRGEYVNYAQCIIPAGFGLNATTVFWAVNRSAATAQESWTRVPVPGASMTWPNGTYAHSFGMTDDHIIFPVNPVTFSVMAIGFGTPPMRALEPLYTEQPLRFQVFPRRAGAAGGKPFMASMRGIANGLVMHSANAYEEADGTIVYDFIRYVNDRVFDSLALKQMLELGEAAGKALESGRLTRCRIMPPAAGQVEGTTDCWDLQSGPRTFPWINKDFYGRKHRWVYTTQMYTATNGGGSIVKVDTWANATVAEFTAPRSAPNVTGGASATTAGRFLFTEAIFVPRAPIVPPAEPNPATEEEGALLSVVYDVAQHRSCLVAIDAKSMESIFELWLPEAMPGHFHGIFCRRDASGALLADGCLWN